MCEQCRINPCACEYVASLLPGGANEWLADTVAEQVQLPLPHRAACPCPLCWAERTRSWDEWAARLWSEQASGGAA